jgi:hypothetical protein
MGPGLSVAHERISSPNALVIAMEPTPCYARLSENAPYLYLCRLGSWGGYHRILGVENEDRFEEGMTDASSRLPTGRL